MTYFLDLEDLLYIAGTVLGNETPKVRDPGLLSSATARPATIVFGEDAYPTLWDKAAALLHSLCKNHALFDGNKRLAWAAARTFLDSNDIPLVPVDVDQAEQFMLAVATGELDTVDGIARQLRALYGGQAG